MYLTPVVYSLPPRGTDCQSVLLARLVAWNPLSYLIDTPRQAVLAGRLPTELGFVVASAFALAVFILCVRVFYALQDLVAERI